MNITTKISKIKFYFSNTFYLVQVYEEPGLNINYFIYSLLLLSIYIDIYIKKV
jgi:hypothetical protein